jgi:hypothetical protein
MSLLSVSCLCIVINFTAGMKFGSGIRILEEPYLRELGHYLLIYLLTHSMVQNIIWRTACHLAYQKISCFLYRNRSFITLFTKARHWTLSWASWVQFAPSISVSLRSILMLSSHLRPGFPSGLLPLGLTAKTLWTPLPCVPHVSLTTFSLI